MSCDVLGGGEVGQLVLAQVTGPRSTLMRGAGYNILDQTSLTTPVPSLSHWFGVRRLILGLGKRLLSCYWHAASGSRIRLVSQGCFVGDDDRMKRVS